MNARTVWDGLKLHRRAVVFAALALGLMALTWWGGGRRDAQSQYAPTRSWPEFAAESVRGDLAGQPDAALGASLQEKLGAMQTMQAERDGARAAALDKPADLCAQRPVAGQSADLPRLTGIIEGEMAPFRAEDVLILNQWQENIAGRWVHVYAGRLGNDPAQGVVIVTVEGSADGGRFPAPLAGGALRIVAAQGARLTLQDEAGALLYFDVPALRYVASLDEPAATAVPQPAWTPTPDPCS